MIGAREHYAIPRAMHSLNRLHTLFTDAWAGSVVRRAGVGSSSIRALSNRYDPALPTDRVTAFTAAAIRGRMAKWFCKDRADSVDDYQEFLEIGTQFAKRVNYRLEQLPRSARPVGIYGYNTGCLETLELFRSWGLPTVVNQIDAARVHERLVIEEGQKWPGWQSTARRVPDEYWQRLEAEWSMADRVIVNSAWSRAALISQGVQEEKITIIPLAYEPRRLPRLPRKGEELVVLYVGRVVLEKGFPYLFDAARLLADRRIRFVVAGSIGISAGALATVPPNVSMLGPVPRDRVEELYRSADVFVLPTLSDGFAITQLEAMAHGLPVIATPNCGEVVTDGIDGLIVPARNAQALAAAIDKLAHDRTQLHEMSRKASDTVRRFSIDRLAERIETLLDCSSL